MTDARTEAVKTALNKLTLAGKGIARLTNTDIATTAIAALDAYDREHRAAGVVTEEMVRAAQTSWRAHYGAGGGALRAALEAALAVAPPVRLAPFKVTQEFAWKVFNVYGCHSGDFLERWVAALKYAFTAAAKAEAPPAPAPGPLGYVPNNGALPIVTEHPCAPDARAARLRELDAEVARKAEEAAGHWTGSLPTLFRAIAAAARARAEG